MTLSIHFDNQTDLLLDRLVEFLVAPATGARNDPFARDVIITSNLGLGNWLQRGIADRTGIASGIEFQFPGRFLWQMMSRLLDGVAPQSPFEPEVVRWVLFPLLAQIAANPALEPERLAVLHARFAPSNQDRPTARNRPAAESRPRVAADSQELLILSTQIAQQFAQLLNFRRDWLDRWASGAKVGRGAGDASFVRHEAWMSWLWQQTLLRMPAVSKRHPFDRFKDGLRGDQPAPALASRIANSGVRRIAVFGAAQMSPEQLNLYGQLSRAIEVAFFVPDPSREFWQDLVSPRYLAEIRNSRPDVAWLYQHEPAILGSWGRQHRDFLAQLRELEESLRQCAVVQVDERFRDRLVPPPENNLRALQQAVLELNDEPWARMVPLEQASDHSLQIHACHGKSRQVEVLHDLLLQAFDELPDLKPDQVLVLAPAIDDFAAAIDGVLGGGPIPYSIEGRAANLDPLAQGFVALLKAATVPVTAATIRDLLEAPAISAALALDSAEIGLLVDWLARSGFRQTQGGDKHGWLAASDRLWLGLCMASEHETLPVAQADRVAVAGVTPTTVELLGKLEGLFAGLARLALLDQQRPDVLKWCQIAAQELENWFGAQSFAGRFGGLSSGLSSGRSANDDSRSVDASSSRLNLLDRLQSLAEEVRQAGDSEAKCPLGLGAFVRLLDESDAAARLPVRLGSGVMFASIDAMRSVPARVTVWLGLSDQAFPRQATPLEFDLLQNQPQFGDLTPGIIDRGAFLETVCQTSERLILLFDGRDVRSNEPLNPSLLIEELLAYVQPHQPKMKIVEHSLTRFSPQAFTAPEWPSYDEAAFKAAQRLSQGPSHTSQAALVTESLRNLDDSSAKQPAGERGKATAGTQRQWVASLANPAKAYLTHRLSIELPREQADLGSQTPLDAVDDIADEFKQQTQAVFDLTLAGASDDAIEQIWSLQPSLPDAAFGQLAVRRIEAIREQRRRQTADRLQLAELPPDLHQRLAKQLVRWREVSLESAPIDFAKVLHSEQRVQIIWSAYQEGPFAALDTWLRHQVACLRYPTETVVTHWFGEDSAWSVRGADGDAPIAHLVEAVAQVQTQALVLFPRTYLAWIRAMRKEQLDLDSNDWQANSKVSRAAQTAFERELLDRSQRVLYRDAAPDLQTALAQTGPIYRRFFEALQ